MIELEYASLKTRLDSITKNVSNFNKGRENLSNIIQNSQSTSNKRGLGFTQKYIAPHRRIQNKKILSSPKSIRVNPKRNDRTNSIKIWVPKTNNSLIRNKYIKSFLENVHKSQNYIFKGNTESTWVWFPKT